ncbi:MAG TPA: hypothetical protein VE078_07615, partial [Thermoanaerobaculia bacterium]|nr:hypothetical protein [Thermoanaerobaculia bacterium]
PVCLREPLACSTSFAPQHSDRAPRLPERDPGIVSQLCESGISLRGSWSWIGKSRSQIRAV